MGRFTQDIKSKVTLEHSKVLASALAVKSALKQVRTTRQKHSDVVVARGILQDLSTEIQQEVHRRIAEVVTMCLRAVFPDPYEFCITFEKKRGKTEASITFKRGDLEAPPLEIAGGGAADVAAFALRLAAISLHRPAVRRLLILDEPFRYLSADYRPAMRDLLEDLADKMSVQIVMVTHDTELVCGKVVRLGHSDK